MKILRYYIYILWCFSFPKMSFSYDFAYAPSLSDVKDIYAKFQEDWTTLRRLHILIAFIKAKSVGFT